MEAIYDDRSLPLGGPQQRAVLAVLLAQAGQVVSTERIIAQLWGDDAPATARALVQGCVAGLRRVLHAGGEECLISRPPGYLVRGELDVDRFEQLVAAAERAEPEHATRLLRQALQLWRGPAYDGVVVDVCTAEAARLAERRLTAVDRRIAVDLRLGRHAEVIAELGDLVREHPLREGLWAHLMTALHRAGRRAEALDAYRRIRSALVDELGVEPGAALRELHREVLAGTPGAGIEAVTPGAGTAAGRPIPREVRADGRESRPPVPAQLPAAAAGFTGRAEHLRTLDALLDDAEPGVLPVVVICGSAGVGKTSLAVRWAHTVRERFPGGQLHVDLRGYATTPPLRPIEALTGFLTALGLPAERIPAGVDEAAAVYRSLLAGREVLVVLDNARSAEQVRPLLPGGPAGMVVVTSRDALGGLVAEYGAVPLGLDVLAPGEAAVLLTRVLGPNRTSAEPAAVTALAELCARLPLALRIAAANLATSPRRTVAGYVAELEAGNRLGGLAVRSDDRHAVRTAFDLSYADLPERAREVFRGFGIVPGVDLTADDAGDLLDIARADAGRLLARLAAVHLVDEHADGRYRCHDLLRLYAAERAEAEDPAAERDGAVARLLASYVQRTRAAGDLLAPHMLRLAGEVPGHFVGPAAFDEPAALAWLEAERHNLVLAVQHAAASGPRRLALLLADALRCYFHLRRYTGDWLAVATVALDAARQDGDLAGQAAARHSLGTAHRSVGEHRDALRHYLIGLRLARQCGWQEHEATALGNIGIVCRKLGRLTLAARRLDHALQIDRRLHRRAGEANNLSLYADVLLEMGRLADAGEQFTAALKLNAELGSRHGEALAHTGLAQVHRELGRYDEAREHLDSAMDRYTQVGDRDGVAVTHCGLAALECALGRSGPARDQAAAGLLLAGETGDRETEAIARNALGDAAVLAGDHPGAAGHYRLARALAAETRSLRPECAALLGLAVATPDRLAAEDLARQALGIAETARLEVVVGLAHSTLAGVYRVGGQYRLADRHERAAAASRATSGHRVHAPVGHDRSSQPTGG
ncbi:AfsR/SARP family transcriptional regulator [Actinoplanes palleronii]|uniref:AfsR/SARP family transcriptional regulator n=1 Tax=Actinoplanes palleronii TaxID=113570 RepID=UPI00194464C3|nr:BTAD domain-containing putative transcriptional regulator [Actinoplanes palleronii]